MNLSCFYEVGKVIVLHIGVIGDNRRILPTCTAISDTKVSVHTGLSTPVILRPVRHHLVPAKLHVSVPTNCRYRLHPQSNLTLHRNIAILGAPNAVSTSCHNRLFTLLVGLNSRPFVIGSNRHVTRLIFSSCRPYR